MTTTMKKGLIIGFSLFALVVLIVGVVYMVRKPNINVVTADCAPRYYYNLESKSCAATTRNYNAAEIDCDGGTGKTCVVNLQEWMPGKTAGSCYKTIAQCQAANSGTTTTCTPRYYYNTKTQTCTATNRSYNSQDVDCDGGTGKTCAANLQDWEAGNTTGICYPSQVACANANGGGSTTTNSCSKTFTVACANPSVSPSPIPSTSAPVYPSPSPSSPSSASLDCVAKKMYENDSRNRAGFYYMEREITDTNTVQNGQIIVYNIVTRNNGGNSVPDTTITDRLSTNLTYVDGDSGCGYDSNTRTVTCTIGTLSPNSEAQRSFRASVTVAGTTSVANTAEVTSTNGQRDSCSVSIDATGRVSVVSSPAPTALPVAGVFEVTALPLTLGLLLLIIGGLGLLVL